MALLPNLNYDTRNLAQRGYTRGNVSNTYGFRYAWGNVENSRDFLGVAGILPSSDPGDAITTGSVSYSADYELVRTRSGRTDDVQSGEVLLTADFASGSGTVEGRDGGFRVDGTFRGTDLDGTVTYDGVTADLEGVIGQDRVVGAFAGHDNRGVLVGGIAGRSNQ